jgi:2-isopropylmalate synthase
MESLGITSLDLGLPGAGPRAVEHVTALAREIVAHKMKIRPYCATGVPIPANYPVVGDDAFRTATGVHAAAIIKAYKKKDIELANTVYSGVPSHVFGLEQVIDIGPMSGKSNVHFWLERRGLPVTDGVVERIYRRAKASDHTLTEAEILECVQAAH